MNDARVVRHQIRLQLHVLLKNVLSTKDHHDPETMVDVLNEQECDELGTKLFTQLKEELNAHEFFYVEALRLMLKLSAFALNDEMLFLFIIQRTVRMLAILLLIFEGRFI